MNSTYTFRRTHGGITAFARVTLSIVDGSTWRIDWSDEARPLRTVYGADTEAAIELAASACRARGRIASAVHIETIVETVVDTKPDAVACAAVMAAWKVWGCDESDAVIELRENGRWHVKFR